MHYEGFIQKLRPDDQVLDKGRQEKERKITEFQNERVAFMKDPLRRPRRPERPTCGLIVTEHHLSLAYFLFD